ncbi:hypothetical protein MalM25_18970 [Planctomycetes bacterium MalM25]|nr:hypothetical protein MalM25_18970 [Planctomycetes bacterium MalM25]
MTEPADKPSAPLTRDRLALERTRLANERTGLAYARTAIMLAATGVSLLKFFNEGPLSVAVGWGLIALAGVVGVAGWRRFQGLAHRLAE